MPFKTARVFKFPSQTDSTEISRINPGNHRPLKLGSVINQHRWEIWRARTCVNLSRRFLTLRIERRWTWSPSWDQVPRRRLGKIGWRHQNSSWVGLSRKGGRRPRQRFWLQAWPARMNVSRNSLYLSCPNKSWSLKSISLSWNRSFPLRSGGKSRINSVGLPKSSEGFWTVFLKRKWNQLHINLATLV